MGGIPKNKEKKTGCWEIPPIYFFSNNVSHAEPKIFLSSPPTGRFPAGRFPGKVLGDSRWEIHRLEILLVRWLGEPKRNATYD